MRPARGRAKRARERPVEPTVTVVIPTRNEAGNVDALVAALTDALDGVRAEVIFVDDSDDETPATVGPRRDRAPSSSRSRSSTARRASATTASAARCWPAWPPPAAARSCVMDGDLQHPPAVIHRLLAHADENELDLVLASRSAAAPGVAALSLPRAVPCRTR